MSSIYGYTGNKEAAKLMSDALHHWQPNRENCIQNDMITLGALELFKTPECPLLPQPFVYKHLIVVADCRIDNREELAQDLGINDISKHADIEFIARAFEKYGNNCVKHLVGDFVFAVWNENNKELLLARDHMGVKPLYYSLVDNQLVFSSEIKGILAFPDFEKKVNESYIAHHFSLVEYSIENTLYENIYLLKSGHILSFKNKAISVQQYWYFGMRTLPVPTKQEDVEKEFERLFFLAVKDRLRTYNKLGAEVSGGLDSTGIAGVAMHILGKSAEFYSYSYGKSEAAEGEEPSRDDNQMVKDFCERYGIEKYWTVVNEKDFSFQEILNLYENVYDNIESNGVPSFSSSFLKYAKQNKVGVMFSGWAGDQVVTNTLDGFYEVLSRERKYVPLWKDIRRKHPLKKAFPRFVYYTLKELDNKRFFRKNLATNRSYIDSTFLKKELVQKYNLYSQPSLRYYLKSQNNIQSYFVRNICHAGIEQRTIHHVLTGKHFNIDYRFPMLDIRLLEYLYSLPFEKISFRGRNRYLFSKAMLPYIPHEVIKLKKSKVPTTPFVFKFRVKIADDIKSAFENIQAPQLSNYFSADYEKKALADPSKILELLLFLKIKLKSTKGL